MLHLLKMLFFMGVYCFCIKSHTVTSLLRIAYNIIQTPVHGVTLRIFPKILQIETRLPWQRF